MSYACALSSIVSGYEVLGTLVHVALKSNKNSKSLVNLSKMTFPDNDCCISLNLLLSNQQCTKHSWYSFENNKGPFSSQKKGSPLHTSGLNILTTSRTLCSITFILAYTVSSILFLATTFLAPETTETLFWIPYQLVESSEKEPRKLMEFSAVAKGLLCTSPNTISTFFLAFVIVLS